jgi:signal transduction histidine kinase
MPQPSQPPRAILVAIAAVTIVPLGLLLWLGWRFLGQERIVQRQQAQDHLERAADVAVAALQRTVAATEQRLAGGERDWPGGAVSLAVDGASVEVWPPGRVAWRPSVPALREARSDTFADGETLEFRRRDRAGAIRAFAELARSADPAVRAGALLRLARNLKAEGRIDDAAAAYSSMIAIHGVAVAGTPAALAARYGLCKLLQDAARPADLRREATALAASLRNAEWLLTAPVYLLYISDAAAWASNLRRSTDSETLAGALEAFVSRASTLPDSGRELLRLDGSSVVMLWTRSAGRLRALAALPGFVDAEWLPRASAAAAQQHVRIALGTVPEGAKVVRTAAETSLPWPIAVAPDGTVDTAYVQKRRFLVAGFILLASMAVAAGFLIFRAVSREFAVARLQSDFVAAVSHEFRTPLTTLRQFTDMLRDNVALPAERRALCYDAQARATDRLTRLVESLLDFGRMEAGSRPYRFERRDCAGLARNTVDEFRAGPQAEGYDIALDCGNVAAEIDADPEALSRALWNLLDNAVKYSPDSRAVEVALHSDHGTVAISVRDHGIGIPTQERRSIFGRFHRGEQARQLGIKGTGIGLAMVHHIVRAHRGRVEVESSPGEGSTFTVILPVKELA